jgi:hypothetical protein
MQTPSNQHTHTHKMDANTLNFVINALSEKYTFAVEEAMEYIKEQKVTNSRSFMARPAPERQGASSRAGTACGAAGKRR